MRLLLALTLALCIGCEDPITATDASVFTDAGASDEDAGPPLSLSCDGLPSTPPARMCEPLPTDFSPGASDMWDACISDDGTYHRVLPDISTISRVMAFEELSVLLFDPTRDPTPEQFLEARLIYQRDEGLDSRVVRRYDPHYAVPDGTDCTLPGVPDAFPDYCIGPAQLSPMILEAFAAGIGGAGDEPARLHAARIEGALLWFFYVSAFKESLTCTTVPKDCDSSYAYYTGAQPRTGGIGLAGRVIEVDPDAHSRAWDGLLAVRCWRDLDPGETAMDLATRDLARTQYDRAVLDGVAAVVRDQVVRACEGEGLEVRYRWTVARTIGRFMERAARERDGTEADALRDQFANEDPAMATPTRAVEAIDRLFDCP